MVATATPLPAVNLKINGQPITVPAGTTILEAARTMYRERIDFGSKGVRLIDARGRKRPLVPGGFDHFKY